MVQLATSFLSALQEAAQKGFPAFSTSVVLVRYILKDDDAMPRVPEMYITQSKRSKGTLRTLFVASQILQIILKFPIHKHKMHS